MATVKVLGTAQDGGSPQLGGVGARSHRLVASIAVVGDGGEALLIDVTPDVRRQATLLAGLDAYVRPASGNVVDHLALTHAHMGHYAGLVHFGTEAHNSDRVRCWMTQSMADYLLSNQPWRALFDNGNLVTEIADRFQPFDGVSVRMVPVPHRRDFSDAVGYSINEEVLYIPDIDGWDVWADAEAEIAGHSVAVVDATFFSPDELPDRDLCEIPHPLVTDTIDRFAGLDTRIVLTHLNHSNPIADAESPQAAAVLDAGAEVAYDGMEFRLG